MNGDEVRNTTFLTVGGFGHYAGYGYDASEVDVLLGRVAAELDAGRPAGPLIENAKFQTRRKRQYDIDAVDWFLDQLLLHERHPRWPERTETLGATSASSLSSPGRAGAMASTRNAPTNGTGSASSLVRTYGGDGHGLAHRAASCARRSSSRWLP